MCFTSSIRVGVRFGLMTTAFTRPPAEPGCSTLADEDNEPEPELLEPEASESEMVKEDEEPKLIEPEPEPEPEPPMDPRDPMEPALIEICSAVARFCLMRSATVLRPSQSATAHAITANTRRVRIVVW